MKLIFLRKGIFLILPVFYLLLALFFITGIKQYYLSNLDPSYVFLMNGINLASGHFRVGVVEHPGTSVEIFAAVIIFVKHLFSGNTILYQDVLLHSESYLNTISVALAFLISFVTYISGTYVFRYSGNRVLALLFQLAPLFFSEIMRRAVCLSSESFITIYGIFFMAYLYINTTFHNYIPGRTTTNKNVIIFGLFTALLVTTKIYCAPVMVMVWLMITNYKQRMVYLVSSGLFSLVLLFPLYNQLKWMVAWMIATLFHDGFYGQGKAEIIDSKLYASNLNDIFTNHFAFASVFILVMVAFIISLWRRLKKETMDKGIFNTMTGIAAYYILFVLIIAKHYGLYNTDPLTHQVIVITKFYYFIPVFIYFPLAIGISYRIFTPMLSFRFFVLHKQKLFYGLLIIFIAWGGEQTLAEGNSAIHKDNASEKTLKFLNDNKKTTPLIIVTDGNKVSIEPALLLGVDYSGRWDSPVYFSFLKKTYPDTYIYIPWLDQLRFWDQKTTVSEIMGKGKQVMIYVNGTNPEAEETILSKICKGQIEGNKGSCVKIYSSENKYEEIFLLKADTLH